MPEELVQESVEDVVELTEEEKESAAAFDSGFLEETEDAPTENAPPANEVEPIVEQKADEPAPKQDVPAPPAVPALTDAQLQEILAKVKTVDQFGAVVEKLRGDAFGKIGGLERTLKQILEQNPSGQPIEVKPEDLKGIEAEFPGLNLAPVLAKDLTAVLSKMKGAGVAQKGLSQDEIDAMVNTRVNERVQKVEQARIDDFKQIQADRLTDMHEDWEAVIGPEGSQNEFRTWLKANKPSEEKAFYESWNARFIGKFLTEFKKSKEKKPEPVKVDPKPARTQRLAEAVPAKGGGVAPEKPKRSEEEDAFDAGFTGQ